MYSQLELFFWELAVRLIKGVYEPPYTVEHPHLKKDFQILFNVAQKNLRPSIPTTCPQNYANVIKKCLAPLPSNRPTTTELLEMLNVVEKEMASRSFYVTQK